MMSSSPPEHVVRAVTAVLGAPAISWRQATGGYSTAERWIATLANGRSCFAKSGSGQLATFLRAEYVHIYRRIQRPFIPKCLGWVDDGSRPVLLLEDLTDASWPPPWSHARIEAVLQTLQSIRSLAPAIPGLESFKGAQVEPALDRSWHAIEKSPQAFLSLRMCSSSWLTAALPALKQAAEGCVLTGNDALHFDVRSDNLCFRGNQAFLIDWNHICIGNGELDIAFWLPSLHSEGGPAPEEVATLAPEWPAVVSGYFAARAGLPPIPQAPRVREVQLSQLRAALPWAMRALNLPPLDGPAAISRT